ncbi:hypothetical protein PCK1_000554 [Pneumocystis canis]|nr:hypothetical protein PCK1_000554 [Pneumocystis canis]
MKTVFVSSSGKVKVIFFEHAVVYGKAAIASSISLRSYLMIFSDELQESILHLLSPPSEINKMHISFLINFIKDEIIQTFLYLYMNPAILIRSVVGLLLFNGYINLFEKTLLDKKDNMNSFYSLKTNTSILIALLFSLYLLICFLLNEILALDFFRILLVFIFNLDVLAFELFYDALILYLLCNISSLDSQLLYKTNV